MSNPNPYEPPHEVGQLRRSAAWKAFLLLNVVLVMIPVVVALGFYVWFQIEAWRATQDNHGDPVTYQHFFWIAPSGYALIALYFLLPNGLLFLLRRPSRSAR